MTLTKIGTDGVKDDAITSGKIPSNAVGSSELADNSVDTNAIQDQAVALSKLPHGTSSTDGKFLRANNGADPTFETVNTDLVADTSPQLGGDLDTNSNHILLNDTAQLKMGASNDFIIRHNGTDNTLGGNATTKFFNPLLEIYKLDGTKKAAAFNPDGATELYNNNSKKFETFNDGIKITGDVYPEANNTRDIGSDTLGWNSIWASTRFRGNDNVKLILGNAQDLQIYHDGTDSRIAESSTGRLVISSLVTQLNNAANTEVLAKFIQDGAVELYHDNTKRIFTESGGGAISGQARFLGHQQGTGAQAAAVHFNADNSHIGIHFSGHGQINRTYTAARMVINGTGGTYGTITYSLGGTGYNSQSSDSRSKKNIVEWTESELDKFKNLQPKLFHFDHNIDSDPKYKGYIAQDNIAAFPEAYNLVDDRYMFNPSGMVHYLMKAVQELTNKVETLETKVAALEANGL